MNCPPVIATSPPPEVVPFMAASFVLAFLVPAIFIAAFIGLLVFLVVKLVQSTERHRVTILELAQARTQMARLEAEMNTLRSGPATQ